VLFARDRFAAAALVLFLAEALAGSFALDAKTAWAAARRATGTRKGEQLT
jgi:hypothetical protein